MLQEKTCIVKSHDIHIDADYSNWITEVKHRYRSSQVKAAVKVNAEKLLFNWLLGRDLVHKKAEEHWGSGVVEQVSLDLRREFPDDEGFSVRNLWYMKQWYSFYTQKEPHILHQLGAELQNIENKHKSKLRHLNEEVGNKSFHQLGNDFPLPFALVPWRHHVEIITKCKSMEEALFYLKKTIEYGLSRDALINCFKSNLFKHQGKIVNNFTEHLPDLHSKLVQEVLKENYDFGFATVGHEIYDEAELEESLTRNITELLLEMGTGFAFIGRQKEILIEGRSRKIDLLFYHIRLRCYIVCELKAKSFEPEFAGKLNYYVNAVDELMKTKDDNPTIGLLVCSDMNNIDVQWSFKGISTPMGVATYNNIKIKDALPSKEQLTERMRLLQKEMQETQRLMIKGKQNEI